MLAVPEMDHVAALLAQVGRSGPFQLVSVPGGGNNRVYRVDGPFGSALLKAYFQHPDDPRDRLGAEFSFCRFAWERGLRCVPQPLVQDRQNGLGIYEFIHGRPLTAAEIGAGEVQQCIAFLRELNRHKTHPSSRELPYGSEACLTLEQHLHCVERRLANLGKIEEQGPLDKEASQLVGNELLPAWDRMRRHALSQAAACGLTLTAAIPRDDECLSPSDFGFHNSILGADGRLRFFDFEYAGWDDPAKTVCDFFCQPALPAPAGLVEHFAHEVVAGLSCPELHLRRISLLLPVYRLKWCCIMLNDFLPVGSRRRSFARGRQDQEEAKRQQLSKVLTILPRLEEW